MRLISFITLCVLSLFTPFPLFLFASFLYMFVWTGYELLTIAVFIDAFFGITPTAYLYTLTMSALIIGAELLRPYLSWYTTRI
jgi:predicted membrane protein